MRKILDYTSWKKIYESSETDSLIKSYIAYKNIMYKTIWKEICISSKLSETNIREKSIYYNWLYPQDQRYYKSTDSNKLAMHNKYFIGKDADSFNIEFKNRLNKAVNDIEWLRKVSNKLNLIFPNSGTNESSIDIINIQKYIKSKLGESNALVKDNGTPSKEFADGIFYINSTKAYIEVILNDFKPNYLLELISKEQV